MPVSNSTTAPVCALPQTLLIRISGEDRVKFLQGQLTNDITRLKPAALMTAGWCTPQGRLLMTPRLFAEDDAVGMLIDAVNAERLIKRLRMYVLRSKVAIEVDDSRRAVGILGPVPEALEGVSVFALSEGREEVRALLALPQGRAIAIVPADMPVSADDRAFRAASAAAGEVWISGAASEAFVPQAVNLELTGGVSFTKGCYTGQEVVSRVEHIGRVSRRAALAVGEAPCDPAPMTEVLDDRGNPAGVVICAGAAGSKAAALVQLSAETALQAGKAPLSLSIAGVRFETRPLPYGYDRSAQAA